MRQYARIKEQHRDAILFFRLGDFYEMFREDAREAARILGLTLTKRNGMPMCGIPYHASHSYVPRLLRAGKKIAICEQTSIPGANKGIVDREVVEIITPGTVTEEDYLESASNNYALAIGARKSHLSFAYMDVSTGEFGVGAVSRDEPAELRRVFARLRPTEVLVQESLLEEETELRRALGTRSTSVFTRYPDWSFDAELSFRRLTDILGTISLKSLGLSEESPEIYAAGVLVEYVEDAARHALSHIREIDVHREDKYLGLDEATQRNLELIANMHDGSSTHSLLSVLDATKTAMGARLLKRRILSPLRDLATIERRLGQVDKLYRNQSLLGAIRERLGPILDLERLTTRLAMDKAHGKDLSAIRETLIAVEELGSLEIPDGLAPAEARELADSREALLELLQRGLAESPSVVLSEGNLIAPGYSEELDRLRELKENSRRVLDEYLAQEREASGIQSLKVKYNRVLGHFLEVTHANADAVPEHFVRRQSLSNAERFTTARLGEIESEINGATERIIDLERELFLEIRSRVGEHLEALQIIASEIAHLDVTQSLAWVATRQGYTRPEVTDDSSLRIEGGRHPVVEASIPPGDFVPNNVDLDASGVCFALITGPNMAGKSTYLRQVALIVLMAQLGSFVPADEARIGTVDRVFCRVGASDNLARGESTFLVEMNETAYILRTASKKSLIIMDEVGRGTGTQDGQAIARAVTEFVLDRLGARTLFASHFHELTDLTHSRLKNLSLKVTEEEGHIVFLKRVQEGPSSESYGIEVARLAGIPADVVERGREILSELRSGPLEDRPSPSGGESSAGPRSAQSGLFSEEQLLIEEIRNLRLDELRPIEALALLDSFQSRLKPGRA